MGGRKRDREGIMKHRYSGTQSKRGLCPPFETEPWGAERTWLADSGCPGWPTNGARLEGVMEPGGEGNVSVGH